MYYAKLKNGIVVRLLKCDHETIEKLKNKNEQYIKLEEKNEVLIGASYNGKHFINPDMIQSDEEKEKTIKEEIVELKKKLNELSKNISS
ncbi:MAG: hypothetical protein ACP5N7_03725 [Candidatus Pacearchaeota archaeon]